MNPKENNWTKNRGIYFQVGLIISLTLALTAFEWKSFEPRSIVKPEVMVSTTDEIQNIDIPVIRRKIPPPPPKEKKSDIFKEVSNNDFIQEEVKDIIKEEPPVEVTDYSDEVIDEEPPEPTTDEPFLFLEEGAKPSAGYKNFYKFLGKKIKYPKKARRMGIEGTVFIQFIVERDGSLTDLQIAKSVGAGCDEEAMRVLKLSPAWNPGKQRGKPVRQRIVLPIKFKLR